MGSGGRAMRPTPFAPFASSCWTLTGQRPRSMSDTWVDGSRPGSAPIPMPGNLELATKPVTLNPDSRGLARRLRLPPTAPDAPVPLWESTGG